MSILPVLALLVVMLIAIAGVAGYLQWRRTRPARHIPHEVVQPQRLGAASLGEQATILQFSTQRCVRCPGVHRTLAEVAAEHSGVVHLDVDLTHRPDIARHFRVLQTPTTLILDRDGAIQTRFGGIPRRDVVELELSRVARV